MFAIENDAVHISVNVPVRFAFKVREAALGRRVTPNELVFTAVSHVLESANAEAAWRLSPTNLEPESNEPRIKTLEMAGVSGTWNTDSCTIELVLPSYNIS